MHPVANESNIAFLVNVSPGGCKQKIELRISRSAVANVYVPTFTVAFEALFSCLNNNVLSMKWQFWSRVLLHCP